MYKALADMNETTSQEARLLRIIAGSKDGLWDWNLLTNEVFFSHQAHTLMDIPPAAKPFTFADLLARLLPEDRQPSMIAMQQLIDEGEPYEQEHHIMLPDGTLRTCLCKGLVTQRDNEGKPNSVSGTITDITHLKHVERSLHESQARLNRVISGADEGFWDWDINQDSLYWSDRLFELLGIPRLSHPLTYEYFESFLPEDDKDKIKTNVAKAIAEQSPLQMQVRMRHISGDYRYFNVRGKPYYDDEGRPQRLSGMIADITIQKEQELQLAESEARFRNLAEASPVMIWMTDERGELTYFNRAVREFYHTDALQGQEWWAYIHPDDRETLEEIKDTLQNPRKIQWEFRVIQPDGSYRWAYTIRTPRWADCGKFLGYMGATIDITQMKLAQQALKEYAFKLEKSNQELDRFVLVASHDLQEPLRKVALFSGFIRETAGANLPSECADYIDRMQKAIARMQTMIDDLLVLSRITRKGKPPQPINLRDVMQSVLAEVEKKRKAVNGTITIGETMTLDADESQLYQVLVNLLDNALKFHKPDVPPVIHVDARAVNANTCEITVSDNGIGFEEHYLERIFQIFERLHGRDEYEGSGIGLAIVQRIVERHHGTITAQSKPNEGATFIIRLPIHAVKT
jgi:PAS domain S-box-containing protein